MEESEYVRSNGSHISIRRVSTNVGARMLGNLLCKRAVLKLVDKTSAVKSILRPVGRAVDSQQKDDLTV